MPVRGSLDADVQQFLAAAPQLLAKAAGHMELQAEPTERGWEMVSLLRQRCRFPRELEMEVYAGIIGQEGAVAFLHWCSEQRSRPVTAREVLDNWPEVADRVAGQRDDLQAATMNDVVTTLRGAQGLEPAEEENLAGYIDSLPRDMRFGLVKALLKIPHVAQALAQDKYDSVVLDAIRAISAEA